MVFPKYGIRERKTYHIVANNKDPRYNFFQLSLFGAILQLDHFLGYMDTSSFFDTPQPAVEDYLEIQGNTPSNLSPQAIQRLEEEVKKLNPQQREAVESLEGPLLVIAGAGSGKTKVATLRVANLICRGASPSSIVGVTFTNKAAKEMRERVHCLVGSSVLVTTFHSLGARILREFAERIGYRSTFVIYDEDDREKLIKMCIKRLQEDPSHKHSFIGISLDDAVKTISSLKNRARGEAPEEFSALFSLYQEELKKASAMDFDDLLFRTLELLRDHEDIRNRLNERWKYLLVDEYQDTNDVQSEIAGWLAGNSANIFAVGDPDQSIYSWRGANLSHILSFNSRFPSARVIRLEQNYRSTNTILEASNAVIECNQQRLEKRLWSSRGKGHPIFCFVARNERQEAEFVADAIQSLIHRKEVCPASEIAILYRTNAQSRSFEDELIRRRIPYVIWGGLSFYQRREVKDIISYARLALIPHDIIAFSRVINTPRRGIGATTVEKLIAISTQLSLPIVNVILDLVRSGFDKNLFPGFPLALTSRQKAGLTSFSEAISLMRSSLATHSAFHIISSAIHDTGYLAFLEQENEDSYIDRKENLEQLLAKAAEWDQEAEDSDKETSVVRFFELLSLETAQQEELSGEDRVTLATVHNAKGLEFASVFLVGLEEDLFPHINVKFGKDRDIELDVEEERRLMYVGMTRAKDILTLTLSQMRMLWGGLRSMRPSRFLYEIPQSCLKKVARFSLPEENCHSLRHSKMIAKEVQPNPAASYTPQAPKSNPMRQQEEKPSSPELTVGDIVLHATHGIGRIENVSHSSMGPTYEIRFTTDGAIRKIVASLAPLTKIGK